MAKNIVLLSDGTGNRAGKVVGTNVWRIYGALDLNNAGREQVVSYDDGVGSQDFKLLKVLGGAFGYGLRANVIDLYVFLCRSYQAGDEIFAFGFSRGAYTVRVLVGLVHCCGIIDPNSLDDPTDLRREAEKNYDTFRRTRFRRFSVFGRKVPPSEPHPTAPTIKFLGLWDTVDAYGFPIDAIAEFWNQVVHPFRFTDGKLSSRVEHACHALSLDDERQTFHPIMWDAEERIEQVWFAGVHSNVGGGYPDDSLSLVSLEWMMEKARSAGLVLIGSEMDRVREQANVHGKLYDSRAGLQAYYRYKPRHIEDFTPRANVHESVFQRIESQVVEYAPLGIPAAYTIVATGSAPPSRVYESGDEGGRRHEIMQCAWNWVLLRRGLYLGLLLLTLILAVFPLVADWTEGGACSGIMCGTAGLVLAGLGMVVPDFAASWLEALRQNPGGFMGFVAGFAVLLVLKVYWTKKTRYYALQAWRHVVVGKTRPPVWQGKCPEILQVVEKVRRHCVGRCVKVFRLIGALVIVVVLAGVLDRVWFSIKVSSGGFCKASPTLAKLNQGSPKTVTLDVSDPCFGTGIMIEKGWVYRIDVAARSEGSKPGGEAAPHPWMDGMNIVAGPDGFRDEDSWWRVVQALPLRRSWGTSWFTLMGRVGSKGMSSFPIGKGPYTFTGGADGELFLYVNDAVLGGHSTFFYDGSVVSRNHGLADVTVVPGSR